MSFIPIIAFCAAMSSGDVSPIEPFECAWVEDRQTVFVSETGCSFRANDMVENMDIVRQAQKSLHDATGYVGPTPWFMYCIELDKLPDFYRHFGVEASDLPTDA